jgi:hypothetical protein
MLTSLASFSENKSLQVANFPIHRVAGSASSRGDILKKHIDTVNFQIAVLKSSLSSDSPMDANSLKKSTLQVRQKLRSIENFVQASGGLNSFSAADRAYFSKYIPLAKDALRKIEGR